MGFIDIKELSTAALFCAVLDVCAVFVVCVPICAVCAFCAVYSEICAICAVCVQICVVCTICAVTKNVLQSITTCRVAPFLSRFRYLPG